MKFVNGLALLFLVYAFACKAGDAQDLDKSASKEALDTHNEITQDQYSVIKHILNMHNAVAYEHNKSWGFYTMEFAISNTLTLPDNLDVNEQRVHNVGSLLTEEGKLKFNELKETEAYRNWFENNKTSKKFTKLSVPSNYSFEEHSILKRESWASVDGPPSAYPTAKPSTEAVLFFSQPGISSSGKYAVIYVERYYEWWHENDLYFLSRLSERAPWKEYFKVVLSQHAE